MMRPRAPLVEILELKPYLSERQLQPIQPSNRVHRRLMATLPSQRRAPKRQPKQRQPQRQ